MTGSEGLDYRRDQVGLIDEVRLMEGKVLGMVFVMEWKGRQLEARRDEFSRRQGTRMAVATLKVAASLDASIFRHKIGRLRHQVPMDNTH